MGTGLQFLLGSKIGDEQVAGDMQTLSENQGISTGPKGDTLSRAIWKHQVGSRPKVTVFERFVRGKHVLYLRWWDPEKKNWRHKSLSQVLRTEGGRIVKATQEWAIEQARAKYSQLTGGKVATDSMVAKRPRQVPSGYVYYAGTDDRVKIGFSKNPWARLSTLRTALPEIKLFAVERGTPQDERIIQHHFSADHIEREWFRLSEKVLDHLQGVMGRSLKGSKAGDDGSSTEAATSMPVIQTRRVKAIVRRRAP